MVLWLVFTAFVAVSVLAIPGGLRVRRYSRSHVIGHVAIGGRGLFFSRTPDGIWWQIRLRPRRCGSTPQTGCSDPPPDGGVREPRRPVGPAPVAGTVELEPPPR